MKTKRIILLLIILITVLSITACKGDRALVFPTAYVWTWEEDQYNLTEANIWNGFQTEKELFKATSVNARFAFWRTTLPETLTFEYILKGKFSIRVFINGKKHKRLNPVSDLTRVTIQSNRFCKGLNLVEFRKSKKAELFVGKIRLSGTAQPAHKNFIIEKGEKVFIPLEAGRVSISLKGKGRAGFKALDALSSSPLTSKSISSPFGFVTKKTEVFNTDPFILELTGLKGHFSVQELSFKPEKTPEIKKKKLVFKEPYPDIFIFLIDACQASHLGSYGYYRKTSPHIDSLAEDSIIFENAYANASFTRATVATIFTGYFPEHHKVRVMKQGLPAEFLTLPEFMKSMNYTTSIFSATGNISKSFGFDQGVDEYFNFFHGLRKGDRHKMAGEFNKWVDKTQDGPPRFAYVHFIEPHFPIIPPPPFLNMYKKTPVQNPVMLRYHNMTELSPGDIQDLIDDYDSAITYIDHKIGTMLAHLREKGLYEDSLIIFLSDHGEALYEHKFFGHGHEVYNEITHIPLIIKFPARMNLKGRVQTLVQTTDIFPTITRLFDVKKRFDGRPLTEAFFQKTQGDEFTVSRNFIKPGSFGLRWRNFYYIINLENFNEELYNLDDKPELDIISKNKFLSLYLRTKFLIWLWTYQGIQKGIKKVDLKNLSEAELENLRALGYIK